MRVIPPPPLTRRLESLLARCGALWIAMAAIALPGWTLAQDLAPLPQLTRDGVRDRTADDLIRVRWELPADALYPGQRATIAIVLSIDAIFQDEQMVQPFTRRLDWPVALDAPQLTGLEALGAWGLAAADAGRAGPTLAVGDAVIHGSPPARASADGRDWRTVRIPIEVRATRSGLHPLDAPVVRFAAAENFRDDLLGRTPIGAQLALVRGAATKLLVSTFPEGGRSPDFAGALGLFSLNVTAETRTLQPGDSLDLVVKLDGDLPGDDSILPRLDRWRGLHLLGQHVRHTQTGVLIEAELRIERASVREIPALEFHSFDTHTGQYLVARSTPVPLVVTMPSGDADDDERRTQNPWYRLLVWPIAFLLAVGLLGRIRALLRSRDW